MTKTKIDAMTTASNAIQSGHGSALLQTLARALETMMDGEANWPVRCGLRGAKRGAE